MKLGKFETLIITFFVLVPVTALVHPATVRQIALQVIHQVLQKAVLTVVEVVATAVQAHQTMDVVSINVVRTSFQCKQISLGCTIDWSVKT